jgi:hypothetical protein
LLPLLFRATNLTHGIPTPLLPVLCVIRIRRGPKLGTHWPAPLELDFDIDDVRDELGIEVPRGFVCPLTLDIMKQPALLLSSNIAVPSSYEKEAITRWLADNRCVLLRCDV